VQLPEPDGRGILRLVDFLTDEGRDVRLTSRVVYPVLVESLPAESLPLARVFCPMLMPARPAPPGERLDGELLRYGLGRGETNEVRVDEASISRRHAALVRAEGDVWSVADLGSSNGTWVAGDRVAPGSPAPITRGDVTIRLGRERELRLLRAPDLKRYLASLRASVTAPTSTEVRLDRAVVSRILLAVRTVPLVPRRFTVVLEGALVEELVAWSEFVDLIETEAARVVSVEVAAAKGKSMVVYRRPTTSNGEGNDDRRTSAA
jgi:hypothetical protein